MLRVSGEGLSPRVRGAFQRHIIVHVLPGLSPRVRGSPFLIAVFGDAQRSIPACAGEPKRKAIA